MNKTAIKNFAIWARNKLIADIVYQAGLLGVTEKGIATALPQSTREVQFFDIGTKDYMTVRGKAIHQRDAFVTAIKIKQAETDYVSAFRFVVEKVAYTWFNRLIAIRFMEVNDYLPSRVRVLSSENPGKAEPDMVTRPYDTDMFFSAQEQDEIMRMKDENQLDELFRMLFIKQCQKLNEVLPGLFDAQGIERADSYLELLLTISFTDKDGVLWHLTHDISEDDFNVEREGQIEIIGWMYQYYNTEPKDLVFANLKKNIKISKDSIPAATQLFTPDWIVRYMVENSLGRLWIEGHPNCELKKNWKYYLEEAEQDPQVQTRLSEMRKQYVDLHPEDLKAIDPCMGSGHILVYLFDVLLQIYESQGWTQREAAQSIVQNNLYGLDIDDRAAQLAYFAVMMKARQYDRRFLERGIIPNVFGIQESNSVNRDQIKLFGLNLSSIEKNSAISQLYRLLDLLWDAKEYGSILDIPDLDWDLLQRYTKDIDDVAQITLDTLGAEDTLKTMQRLVRQARIMAQKYHAVITNPPYMGRSNMGNKLNTFLKDNYPDSKSDTFAVFIEKCKNYTIDNYFQAMITQHAWMFLSSFESLRNKLLNNNTVNMLHLGSNAFDEIQGDFVQTTTFVMRNCNLPNYNTVYCRLIEPDTEFGKESLFLSKESRYIARQDEFKQIPTNPVAYWASEHMIHVFAHPILSCNATVRSGMQTGNNDLFLRYWYEVPFNSIGFSFHNHVEFKKAGYKWAPQTKGGLYRKWYGNYEYVVNFENDCYEISKYEGTVRIRDLGQYFKQGITWTHTTAGGFGARLLPEGFTFNVESPSLFSNSVPLFYIMGNINSTVAQGCLWLLNSAFHYHAEDILNLPILYKQDSGVEQLVKECIEISKAEWDSFETSWNFIEHPLVASAVKHHFTRLADCWSDWECSCNERFVQLKTNEEKLNRIFIDIYSLQEELLPEVPEKDVTIRKADQNREIRSLISYAVGCMFGRYSLDANGIIYAGGMWDSEKYEKFLPDPDNCVPITDEAYFDDDIVGRFVEFIRAVYGVESLEENLNFIANTLGNKGNSSREVIRNYFLNDFIKDHSKTYQRRPIYWLFDSGKQNGFKALVYMHRWSADTVGNLRVEYLHRMQRVYEKEIVRMQDIINNSKDNREVNHASKRREKLVKQLKEARDYDAKIAHVALSRVEIDLDDGIKVNYEKVQKGPDGKSLGILAKI